MTRRALLVEGYMDALFVKGVLAVAGIKDVSITPPKDIGASGNGVSNVEKILPAMLLKATSGELDSFGILIDADFTGINGGFAQRQAAITTILSSGGYSRLNSTGGSSFGDEFRHPTQIPMHLGIFPDHSSDGMVESMLSNCVSPGDQEILHNHAKNAITSLPKTLFNSTLHNHKAEISTLLAWQKSPGLDNGIAVRNGVFDTTKFEFLNLINWLKKVFP